MPLFTTLHPLLQSSALHIIIVAEGDKQRVTVQPKPTGKGADVPPALSLLGTPEEFDAEFAAAAERTRSAARSRVRCAAWFGWREQ